MELEVVTNGVQLDGSRWRRISLRAVLGVLMAALPVISGCGYSDVTSASSGIAVRETVRSLQETVGHYQEDNNGLLPIQNANETDAIYEKYRSISASSNG
jgi:hypothetical protein